MKTVEHEGRTVEAEDVNFEAITPENWTHYKLDDGSTIKMKTASLEVRRLIGEYHENGDPVYQFTSQQLLAVQAPDELKKPKGE